MNDNSATPASKTYVRTAIAIAVALVGGSLLLTAARSAGLIGSDVTTRGVMILIGLGLAIYTNLTPKMLQSNQRSVEDAAVAQSIARFTGWIMTLAFLVWTAIWTLAPHSIANAASVAVVGICVTLTLGFILWKSSTLPSSGNS